MDTGIIVAIISTSLASIAVTISLFLWLHSEANGDRRDFFHLFKSIDDSIMEIKLENKEFHHRLLEIERSRK